MKAFLARFKISTHAVAVTWAALVGAYGTSTDFRNEVNSTVLSLYHALPPKTEHLLAVVFSLAVPLYAWYRNGQKGLIVTQTVLPSSQNVSVEQTSEVKKVD